MKSGFEELWNEIDQTTFYLEEEGRLYRKNEIDDLTDILIRNLNNITEWNNRLVYLDLNRRFFFILVFLALIKLKAKIVLVPPEIKIEDYFYSGGLFITDNKELNNGLMIKKDLTIKLGDDFDAEHLEPAKVSDNVDLYLYTSGTTGKSKLIPKSALHLITEVKELKSMFHISKSDIFYVTPPLYHIYGLLFGWLLPIHASAPIILDYQFTPESISEFVNNKNITQFISIPSYYKMFAELNLISLFSQCRQLFSSSAPLSTEISKKFFENRLQIIEVYGSTETGGIAHRVSAVNPEWKLYSYVKIFTDWDDYLEPFDPSDPDKIIELKIISPAISVEYDHSTGYNTGDMINLQDGGSFILLGRNMRFVKISGKRIDINYVQEKVRDYLAGINFKLNEDELYTGVKDQKIFILCEKALPLDSRDIKNALKKHLPSYAVPRLIIHATIPKNFMGKIDKQKVDEILTNYHE